MSTSGSITITLTESAGVGRVAEPTTVSVPFARGELTEANLVTLRDETGNPIHIDRRILARWADGSVRWLQLGFCASLESNQTSQWQVAVEQAGPQRGEIGPPESAIDVLSLVRNRTDFVVVDGEGVEYRAEPIEVSSEHSSPMRAIVRLDGEFRSPAGARFGRFEAWLETFTESSLARLIFTYIGDEDDAFQDISDLRLEIPLGLLPATRSAPMTPPLPTPVLHSRSA